MQQHFNLVCFTVEQQEYAAEHIDVAHVAHVDNQHCLDLIENGPHSILSMCDEEAKLPKGSDENLLLRMHTQHANKHPYYLKPKTQIPQFGIRHYAGDVQYHIAGFLVKNQDQLEQNIADVVLHSHSQFVQQMVPAVQARNVTVGAQFKQQLNALMSTLNQTAPHFIRCIKSNLLKIADTLDGPLVVRQMRYLGLKGVIDIRQRGYPIRKTHLDFYQRYKVLCQGVDLRGQSNIDYGAVCQHMLQQLGVDAQDWRIGTTKVFVRQQLQSMLESARESKFTQVVVFLQSCARTKIWRARFKRYKATEQRVRQALKGNSADEIDRALEAYEGLRLKVKSDLVQAAVQRRNDLIEGAGASRALETALKLRDITLLNAALSEASKQGMSAQSNTMFAQAQQLQQQLSEYQSQLTQCLTEQRSNLELLQYIAQQAHELQLNGPQEQQVFALLTQLQADMQAHSESQQRLAAALQHALSIAMQIKSGQMINLLLAKAAHHFGPEWVGQDSQFAQATAEVTQLSQDIQDMEIELQAACATEDADVVQQVVQQAQAAGFASPTLDTAMGVQQTLQARDACLEQLRHAVAGRDMSQLEAALTLAAELQLPGDTPECLHAAKLHADITALLVSMEQASSDGNSQELERCVAQARALGLQNLAQLDQAAATVDSAAANKDGAHLLQAAMQARDVTLLFAAIQRAQTELQPPMSSDDPTLMAAQTLLEELASESDALRSELQQARAAVKRGTGRKSVAASTFGRGGSPQMSNEAMEAKIAALFDEKKYSRDEFELARFPELRSANAYAADSMFNKKALKLNMLKYTRDVIPKSLTQMDDDKVLNDKSLELFKSVQGFCLDRHYSFPDTLVCELIDEILLWPALRDELYVQVMKQLSNSNREESYLRCWQLLSLLSEFVPPSDEMIPFVLHFVNESAQSAAHISPQALAAGSILASSQQAQQGAQLYGLYVQHTLRDTYAKFRYQAPMRNTPEHAEAVAKKEAGKHTPYVGVDHVTAFRERTMESNDVCVHFPDGSKHTLRIQPWMKNFSLVQTLARVAAIRDTEGLALFELRGTVAQYLYPHECLLDFQLAWMKQRSKQAHLQSKLRTQTSNSKLGAMMSFLNTTKSRLLDGNGPAGSGGAKKEEDDDWSANQGVRRFLLKRRVFGKPVGESKDALALRLMYAQTARECALGYHNIEEPIATTLAAVTRILAESGAADALGPQPATGAESNQDHFASTQLWDCPQHLIARRVDPKRFAKNVEKIRPEIKSASIDAYLHEARKLSTFGAQFYSVERADDNTPRKLPLELVLAVNYFGIYMLDARTRQELDSYALLNVLGWSSSSVRVVVKVKLVAPTLGAAAAASQQQQGTATFRFNTHSPRMGREICDLLLTYANEMMKQVTQQQQLQQQQQQQQ